MANLGDSVRPTKRCLEDLDVKAPHITVPLHELQNPVVVTAQSVPEKVRAGGAERVVKLSDRVWFKSRISNTRAAVTQLTESEFSEELAGARWWIGAAGFRQNDSYRDFYSALERECDKGSGHLLPGEWDRRRYEAEEAIAWRRDVRRMVIQIIATSLRTGHVAVAEYSQHRVMALARADGEDGAYLAIIAEGVPDPNVFALILDCVPGVESSDWQPEPGSVADIEPRDGQIIWSTMFPPGVAAEVLSLADD